MAYWTLAKIQDEIRFLTGRFSEDEISNSDLNEQINRFYQLVFPTDVKLERNYTTYNFLTTPNQPYYTLPDTTYTNLVPPATVDNKRILWYQSNQEFIAGSGLNYSQFTPWQGDGVTTVFTTTLTGVPIYPGTFVITDNLESFEDSETTYVTTDVSLTGSLGGIATINYATGVISVTFNTAPAVGQSIITKYIVMAVGQPQSVLMFNERLQFFPVPNTAYRFSVQAYGVPPALTSPTDTLLLDEWGPAIATGTSREIFRRYSQMEAYSEMTMLYREQVNNVLTKTVQTLMNERSRPSF